MTMKNYGIPPLEKWNTYALSASRKTVVIIALFYTPPPGVYIDTDIDKHPKCVEMKKIFYSRHATLFSKLQIEAVKNVCFVFGARSNISLQTFNSDIILDNANVWFSKWRGIRHDRLPINGHKELERDYEGKEKIQAMVKASPRILRDSRKYVNAYLKANFNEYTAVAFRTQKRKDVLVLKDKYSRKEVIEYFYKCGEEVKNVMRNKYPSNQTFLSIDLGRFGDMSGGGYDYFKIKTAKLKSLGEMVFGPPTA